MGEKTTKYTAFFILAHRMHLCYYATTMAKACAVTNKSSIVGGGYSNRTRATKFTPLPAKRTYANLQKKRVFVPELNKTVTIVVSAKGLRTMKKNGTYSTLRKVGAVK